VKHNQRLDDGRLAEVLHERGMADLESIRELLQQSQSGRGQMFSEALVSTGKVADWDLSRVVCEIFSLPFLPIDVAKPDPEAAEGLDTDFLIRYGLVPISRFGQVLTVSMPGLVPADVLGLLAAQSDLVVLPVVGSVDTNRRWFEENFDSAKVAEVSESAEGGSGWGDMFDDANAAVMMDLEKESEELEFEIAEPEDQDQSDFEPPSLTSGLGESSEEEPKQKSAASLDLPPMPEFGEG